MTTVAVLDDYQRAAERAADWGALGNDVHVTYFHEPLRDEALTEALKDAEIVVLMRERCAMPQSVLERLAALRLLVTTGMTNTLVDASYLRKRGITFCGTGVAPPSPNGGVGGVTEITWAIIFALTKRVLVEDRALRGGSWQVGYPVGIDGMTLGLAGLGRLGALMVPPARVFGMHVVAWSQNLTDERAASLGVRRVSKEELLEASDILSIHLLLSDRTRGLFARDDLARMRPSAFLVNTSRGPIVDEAALLDALRSRTIAGAGLDVFDTEPLPADHPFLTLDNVVLLPHLGYVTEENMRYMYSQVVEDIAAFLAGSPIRAL